MLPAGILLMALAVLTILGLVPLPKVLITLEFFGGLYLIFRGVEQRRRR